MEVRVDNPEKVERKKVDSSGKVYVGTAYAGKELEIVVGEQREVDDE